MKGTTIVYLLISSVKVNNLAVDKTLIARTYRIELFSYNVFICSAFLLLINDVLVSTQSRSK